MGSFRKMPSVGAVACPVDLGDEGPIARVHSWEKFGKLPGR
jgi:hypothetical protein